MRGSYLKRVVSIFMTLVLCVVFTAATTVPVNAASKKTYQVVASEKCISYYNGEKKSTYNYTYTYNKNGLMTKATEKGPYTSHKTTYKRNKKGYVIEAKYYNGTTLYGRTVFKLKSNGDVKTAIEYSINGKNSTKVSTSTYSYWKRGKVKQIKTKASNYTDMFKYDKKGYPTYYKSTSNSDSGYATIRKYTNKYNKKGDPVKITENSTETYDGDTYKYKYITTYTYKYNKKGNPVKCVAKWKSYEGDALDSYGSDTSTYKYKNVKVPKKYRRFFKRGSMTLRAL